MSDETPSSRPPGRGDAESDPGGTQRYADPLHRTAARILDLLIWAIGLVGAGYLVAGGQVVDVDAEVGYGRQLVSNTLAVALVAAYETWFVGARGRTPGKMALGIRVVRADGAPPGYRDAAVRIAPFVVFQGLAGLLGASGQVLTIVPWFLAVVSVVLVYTDRRRQAVWDKLARTLVVAAEEGPPDDQTD